MERRMLSKKIGAWWILPWWSGTLNLHVRRWTRNMCRVKIPGFRIEERVNLVIVDVSMVKRNPHPWCTTLDSKHGSSKFPWFRDEERDNLVIVDVSMVKRNPYVSVEEWRWWVCVCIDDVPKHGRRTRNIGALGEAKIKQMASHDET